MLNFVIACLWRYVAAVPDNAERNFLWEKSTKNIYSLDEDAPFRETGPSPFKYSNVKNEEILKFVSEYIKDILKTMKEWIPVFEQASKLQDNPYDMKSSLERLQSVQTEKGVEQVFFYEWKTKSKSKKEEKDSSTTKRKAVKDKSVKEKKQKTSL
jgi:hypothetical protein